MSSLLLTSSLQAQTKTIAERLGHPAGSKLVILHADDLGVAHSENAASFDALDRGAVNSASVMMTTPWVTEVAEYANAHPNVDLGVHLTLTSEWHTYRWGSVESRDNVPSLLDPDGTLPREVRTVASRAKIAEVERELRAQVERALAMGIRPTHLDSHMGALFATPELTSTYVKVARDYELPFLAMHGMPGASLAPNEVALDSVVMADETVKAERWKQYYLDAVSNLKPGLTEILVHLGYDDAELQAVTVKHDAFGSAWRARDHEVLTSPELMKALSDNQVILVTWRELGQLVEHS